MKITSWLMLRDEGNTEWNVRIPRGLCREWCEARAAGWVRSGTLWTRNSVMMITIWPCLYCTCSGVVQYVQRIFSLPPISDSFHADLQSTTSLPTPQWGEINEWWDELHNQHSTQPQYSTSFRWQDVSGEGETCWMFPSWYQSRATSALMTFSIFPLSESLSSLARQCPMLT